FIAIGRPPGSSVGLVAFERARSVNHVGLQEYGTGGRDGGVPSRRNEHGRLGCSEERGSGDGYIERARPQLVYRRRDISPELGEPRPARRDRTCAIGARARGTRERGARD